jgi:hypothetical protein
MWNRNELTSAILGIIAFDMIGILIKNYFLTAVNAPRKLLEVVL